MLQGSEREWRWISARLRARRAAGQRRRAGQPCRAGSPAASAPWAAPSAAPSLEGRSPHAELAASEAVPQAGVIWGAGAPDPAQRSDSAPWAALQEAAAAAAVLAGCCCCLPAALAAQHQPDSCLPKGLGRSLHLPLLGCPPLSASLSACSLRQSRGWSPVCSAPHQALTKAPEADLTGQSGQC